jgi:hypothetical protein
VTAKQRASHAQSEPQARNTPTTRPPGGTAATGREGSDSPGNPLEYCEPAARFFFRLIFFRCLKKPKEGKPKSENFFVTLRFNSLSKLKK